VARRAETPVFIAMRATDPRQHLLYFVRDPWPWGKPHEAAGVHRTSQQLGSSVAAPGARATSEAADHRLPWGDYASRAEPIYRRFRAETSRTRLDRRTHRCDRISLGGGTKQSFAEFAAEFVRLKVDVILTHNTPPVLAAKQATSVIPIVFATAADPVGTGVVASLARPGSNVTGLSSQTPDVAGKRIELLRDVVPGLRRFAILANPDNSYVALELREVQAAARMLDLEVALFEIRRAEDIALAFEGLKGRADALYIMPDPLLFTNRLRINTLALGARLPTIHSLREYVEASGLISYGANWPHQWRRAADYVDKILRGAKPADLPVEQPTRFDLIINLTTAKALGLTIPPMLLSRADEVIE